MLLFGILLSLLFFGCISGNNNETWIASMNPISFSNTTLINLLNTGGYAILSAAPNPAMPDRQLYSTDQSIRDSLTNLSLDLTNAFLYSNVLGKYDGAIEDSFLVVLHNKSPDEERAIICQLGEKYNQDSVIYVRKASPTIQQLIYTTGPLNGTYVEGQGYQILSTNVTDNYSSVRLCPNDVLTFTLNFDFEQMVTGRNSRTKTGEIVQHHARNRMLNQWRQAARRAH